MSAQVARMESSSSATKIVVGIRYLWHAADGAQLQDKSKPAGAQSAARIPLDTSLSPSRFCARMHRNRPPLPKREPVYYGCVRGLPARWAGPGATGHGTGGRLLGADAHA